MRKTHSRRLRPDPKKAIDIPRTEEISQPQLQSMATENPSLEKIVGDEDINMTKTNAQLKEISTQKVTS